MWVCLSCGNRNPPAFRFCGGCGAPLDEASPPRTERKVVTVEFIDMVGSTARAERMDPEQVAALLASYHSSMRWQLERHGGTVEKFIGDAVVAVFGVPVVHEDDPERAVRAALAIRARTAERGLTIRIGVNTGEALVRLDRKPDDGEGMVFGDVVNTAARLETAAEENEILVGETTRRATMGAVDYGRARSLTVKGKSQPVRAWPARKARSRFGAGVTPPVTSAFIGRQRELAVLTAALQRAQKDRRPELVTVVGAPGVGKSRLVSELFRHVDARPDLVTWRQGQSPSYGTDVSLWALGEIVKAQAGILESDRFEALKRKLHLAVTALIPDQEEMRWVEAHLLTLLGASPAKAVTDAREDDGPAAWAAFLAATAAQRPTVLVFEDLQWGDDALLDFVESLVNRVDDVPLLVLVTARLELLERRPHWSSGGNANTLRVAPMSSAETESLMDELLGVAAHAEARQELVELAGGNPLFAEQFVRMLQERGEVGPAPDSVQAVIAARLDALPHAAKQLLQNAAVLGRVFWPGGVAAVGGTAAPGAQQLLGALERQEFIRRVSQSSIAHETEFTFHHVVLRDVAYAEIPRASRAEKHYRAAEWTAGVSPSSAADRAEVIAYHYRSALELAGLAGRSTAEWEPVARDAFAAASVRAWNTGNYTASAHFAEEAAALSPPNDARRAALLFAAARGRYWSEGSGRERMRAAIDGMRRSGDLEAAAEAAYWMSRAAFFRGDSEEADRYFAMTMELTDATPDSPARLRAVASRIGLRVTDEGAAAVLADLSDLLRRAERLGLDDVRARLLNVIGVARVLSGDREGLTQVEQAVRLASGGNMPEQLEMAYTNLGDLQRKLALLSEAGSTAVQLRGVVERHGTPHWLRWIQVDEAELAILTGRWSVAEALIDELIERAQAESPRWDAPQYLGARAILHCGRDDLTQAKRDARKALARTSDSQLMAWPFTGLVMTLYAEGCVKEVQSLIASAAMPRVVRAGRQVTTWLACVATEVDREQPLREAITATPLRTPWDEMALDVLDGTPSQAADRLVELGALGVAAYVRLHAGSRLWSSGRRDEARTELDDAVALARQIGAKAWERRAIEESSA